MPAEQLASLQMLSGRRKIAAIHATLHSMSDLSSRAVSKSTSTPVGWATVVSGYTTMSSLQVVVRDKLIPWAKSSAGERIIVARPSMKPADLPDSVEIEESKIPGKRKILKNRRVYAKTREQNALWPEAHLNEIENPKLVIVTRGRTDYQINNYLLHAGEGHFIFLPPGTPHPDGTSSHIIGGGFCELLNIILHRNAIQVWFCLSENDEHLYIPTENYLLRTEKVVQLFQVLMAEAIDGDEGHQFICESLLTAFFTALQRELLAGRYWLPGRTAETETPVRPEVDFATGMREYIKAHLHESLTLEDAARHAHLSRAQFARQIKNETGKTFVQLLTECRIEEAKTLLREYDWSSGAVAEFVGFKSVTYFHSLFVQETGMTPGQFRRQTSRGSGTGGRNR